MSCQCCQFRWLRSYWPNLVSLEPNFLKLVKLVLTFVTSVSDVFDGKLLRTQSDTVPPLFSACKWFALVVNFTIFCEIEFGKLCFGLIYFEVPFLKTLPQSCMRWSSDARSSERNSSSSAYSHSIGRESELYGGFGLLMGEAVAAARR